MSLDLLRRACLGEKIDLSGQEIAVIGAGDVALDAARVSVRLGSRKVQIVCRGMRVPRLNGKSMSAEQGRHRDHPQPGVQGNRDQG